MAGQHCKNNRLCQWHKKIARHSSQEGHGNERNADAEDGYESQKGNLLSSIEDGLNVGLPLSHLAVNVLDGNRGIVHHYADSQSQPQES